MKDAIGFGFLALLFMALIPAFVASSKGRNWLLWYIYGFFLFLFAFIHALILKPNENAYGMKKCPKCASVISKDAIVCPSCRENLGDEENPLTENVVVRQLHQERFDGERNIALPAYQLFLTRRFAIEKNATLEKYVIGNDVFDTLDASLQEADNCYGRFLSALREEEEQAYREADELERKRALSNLQLAEQKAQREELEAKLASSREANLKKSLIAGTAIFTIGLVVLSVYGFNKYVEERRLTEIKIKEKKIKADLEARRNAEFVEMFSSNKFFGYEIGANNLDQLSKTLPDFYEDKLTGERHYFCHEGGCDSLLGGSSLVGGSGLATRKIVGITFTYCFPDHVKASSSNEPDLKDFVLTGVYLDFGLDNGVYNTMLKESGIKKSGFIFYSDSIFNNIFSEVGVHRVKAEGAGVTFNVLNPFICTPDEITGDK